MRIEYDREADALYIYLLEVKVEDNQDIEEGVTVDLDGDGHIVGLEILDASVRLGSKALSNIAIENLVSA